MIKLTVDEICNVLFSEKIELDLKYSIDHGNLWTDFSARYIQKFFFTQHKLSFDTLLVFIGQKLRKLFKIEYLSNNDS